MRAGDDRWASEEIIAPESLGEYNAAGRSAEMRHAMEYAVIIEGAAPDYSAYVPDLPGCVAAADSIQSVTQLMREAIQLHLRGMREDGEPVPNPTCIAVQVAV
jgi:predicted RNase H-like HicB family nuclease